MKIDLSVIIPVRNEGQTILILVEALELVLNNLSIQYEIIFVTDINKDNTWEVLKKVNNQKPNIKLIKLSTALGQHIAIYCGLEHCKGSAILIMDGDMEMPPNEIPKLYKKFLDGYDIVYGYNNDKDKNIIKDFFSRWFNKIFRVLSDLPKNSNTDLFRIISRRTLEQVIKFKEIEPNITFLMSFINYPTIGVKIDFEKRKYDKSNYNFYRKLNLAISSLFAFSTKPLRFISIVGFFISFSSILFLLFTFFGKIFRGDNIYDGLGFGTIVVLLIMFSGVQLFAMGIIGEYLGRVFKQTKKRPNYIIEEKIGDFKSST